LAAFQKRRGVSLLTRFTVSFQLKYMPTKIDGDLGR
jgi:hypothetical protein